MKTSDLRELLERLSGQTAPAFNLPDELQVFTGTSGLGHSQLNELLLLFGLDRITPTFFQFLVSGETAYHKGAAFSSLEEFAGGIERFRKFAVLLYGNVKFAFKLWSRNPSLLDTEVEENRPIADDDFLLRHLPVLPVVDIHPEDAYLTGYIVGSELDRRLKENAEDPDSLRLVEKRTRALQSSLMNQRAYLTSDHLDVYVATSMREKHEFQATRQLVSAIFSHRLLEPLRLRWFDPTQAYCDDRIDKGLSEALMLRRALCTIYLAQENDTLGKDSELASTLAQGKPVIVFIPEADEKFVEKHIQNLCALNPHRSEGETMLDQLAVFDSNAAWNDDKVRQWCHAPKDIDTAELRSRLSDKMRQKYDGRARTLQEIHPLGIQVNVATGVATGVLVVRTIDKCAELVRSILTQRLEFDLEETNGHILLREKISNCVFRVVTRDDMLTNTFWNFYRDPVE